MKIYYYCSHLQMRKKNQAQRGNLLTSGDKLARKEMAWIEPRGSALTVHPHAFPMRIIPIPEWELLCVLWRREFPKLGLQQGVPEQSLA